MPTAATALVLSLKTNACAIFHQDDGCRSLVMYALVSLRRDSALCPTDYGRSLF